MALFGRNAMVATCHVHECSYNQSMCCHAPEIQVGDSHPMCDTFTTQGAQELQQNESKVGGCKVAQCAFNDDMDCNAPGITVNHHSNHADCETFRMQ